MVSIRRTKKYLAARAKLRELGVSVSARSAGFATAEDLYCELADLDHAWDPRRGWYKVVGRPTGAAGLRIEGTFKDVRALARQLGIRVPPKKGRAGVWLVYGEAPSGAAATTKRRSS